jgi:hypothetical protein
MMYIIGRCRNTNNFRRKKHQDNQRITVQPHGRTDRPRSRASGPIFAVRPHGILANTQLSDQSIYVITVSESCATSASTIYGCVHSWVDTTNAHSIEFSCTLKQRCLQMES